MSQDQSPRATELEFVTSRGSESLDNPRASPIISLVEEAQDNAAAEVGQSDRASPLSRRHLITILSALFLDILIASFTAGVLTSSLPQIARSLPIPPNLLFWPSSVNALTSGSTLLLAGSVGDVVGPRLVWLVGCCFLGCFILASGLARTAMELIVFRALQGVASSLCLTNSVSILTRHVPAGRARNIAFGFLGLCQPLGFSIGLVMGGVLESTVGWRSGWYSSASAYMVLFAVGIFAMPMDQPHPERGGVLHRLYREIDWVGQGIASTCLALFSYVLAMITAHSSNIERPGTVIALVISILLAPTFILWIRYREQNHKRALIPNSLWRSRSFTTICVMLLSTYAAEDAMELLCSLYFQNVQSRTPLQSSIRLLPMCIVGTLLSLTTGLFVHRVSAIYLVLFTSLLSAAAPLLMALTKPEWPYWYTEFPSQALMPVSIDVLSTVGILLTSEIFSQDTQALAAGVFNTVGQLGVSIGLAIVGVVSRSATNQSGFVSKDSPAALLVGYRASFWAAFAWTMLACVVGAFGLRKVGKVGLKRD